MSNELVVALSNEIERNERYEAPTLFYPAGRLDRRHESAHALAIRDYERDARERVAAAAAEAAGDIAWIEGRARVIREAKYTIERAQRESEVLAQDDPVRQAKFAILDDEAFAQIRSRANKRGPTMNGLF